MKKKLKYILLIILAILAVCLIYRTCAPKKDVEEVSTVANTQRFSEVSRSDGVQAVADEPSTQPLYPDSGYYLRYYVFRPTSYTLQEERSIYFSTQMCYFIVNSFDYFSAEEMKYPVGYIDTFVIESSMLYRFSCYIPDGNGSGETYSKTTSNSMDCIIAILCEGATPKPWDYIYDGLGTEENEKITNFNNWFLDITELGEAYGFQNGFASGYGEGRQDGYDDGYRAGYDQGFIEGGDANLEITQAGIFYGAITFVKTFFNLTSDFLGTKIVGDITFGLLVVGVPCAFMFVNLAIGLVKKFLGGRGADEK